MSYHNIERELLSVETWLNNKFEIETSLQDSWEIKQKNLTNRKHLSSSTWLKHLSLGKRFKQSNIY